MRAYRAGHFHGIGPGRQLDGRRGGRRAVLAGGPRIAFGAQLDPGHVTNDHAGAIRISTEHDGGERLGRTQLAFHGERNGDPLAWHRREIADPAGGDLRVLFADRGGQITQGQAVGHQLRRVHPDAHRTFGTEQLHAANALDTPQFFDDVARHVVAQGHFVQAAIGGAQSDQHQEARIGGLHAQPVLAHRLRQPRFDRLDAILDVHLGQLRIGARAERGGNGGLARGIGGRGEVQQVLDPGQLALDQPDHGIVHGLRRRPGIAGIDADTGRRNAGIALDRQARNGQRTGQHHENSQHPRKHRALNEKLRHATSSRPRTAAKAAGAVASSSTKIVFVVLDQRHTARQRRQVCTCAGLAGGGGLAGHAASPVNSPTPAQPETRC